jgi:hypothetical protein
MPWLQGQVEKNLNRYRVACLMLDCKYQVFKLASKLELCISVLPFLHTGIRTVSCSRIVQFHASIVNTKAEREITAGQRTMSGQNAELFGLLTLTLILTAHFR